MENNKMPVIFIGHGSPMNAIEDNDYTQMLKGLSERLPKPAAILIISGHWMTRGTFIDDSDAPRQIFDFYGFPKELYAVNYNPPGAPVLAREIAGILNESNLQTTTEWGLDHGAWSILTHLYPKADIPCFQLSLDMGKDNNYHFELGQKLSYLREEGVLLLGSGNVVHNLRNIEFNNENAEPFEWAAEFDNYIKDCLEKGDYDGLINYSDERESAGLAVPTRDHYLPLLYIAGAAMDGEKPIFLYEGIQNGSIAMRSFVYGL